MAKEYGFGKAEKLKSRKRIETLFTAGQAFSRHPVRVVYRLLPEGEGKVLAGVSATKKHFKKAVDRNRIKRLLREAYRLQKRELVQAVTEKKIDIDVFFLFTGRELPVFKEIQITMQHCLQQLAQKSKKFERPA
jgi:ribonuclease P protein component